MLIYDLLNTLGGEYDKSGFIYVSDAVEEEKYLRAKSIKYTIHYFKKYWPYVNLSYSPSDIKNNYLLLRNYYLKENYIFDLIEKVPINHDIFGSCNILSIKINVNGSINYRVESDSGGNADANKKIDLFPIFDYLTEKRINEYIPFIKYCELKEENSFSVISKKAIEKEWITKDQLKTWLGLKKNYRKTHGIIMKNFIKEYDSTPRYSQIFLNNVGKIELNISFLGVNNAGFSDIEIAIKNCKHIIDDINKQRVLKKMDEKEKIHTPDLLYRDNRVLLKNNTKIIYMNIIVPLKLEKKMNFAKLLEFSKKFPTFIITQESSGENSIDLKYKRISAFTNMSDILLEIDHLKEKYDDNSIILKLQLWLNAQQKLLFP